MGWKLYGAADFKAMQRFKNTFSHLVNVHIHFIGVWDTASSFGKITSFKTLQATAGNKNAGNIRHAMAIDEKWGGVLHCQ
jgi:uncharacterized protein (DUF2235 family)